MNAMLFIRHCPACGTDLPDQGAKQCSRCKTRYCGADCQKQHWEAGGHDKLCRKIRKSGGAERYYADQQYKKTVAEAVAECAAATQGQTCYICTEAVHCKTKEGLVRMCACHTTEGFVHLSCLVRQAEIAVADDMSNEEYAAKMSRWHRCRLCGQQFYGQAYFALGWACFKAYNWGGPSPREMTLKISGLHQLGQSLGLMGLHEDALRVREAELALVEQLGYPEEAVAHFRTSVELCRIRAAPGTDVSATNTSKEHWGNLVKMHGEGAAVTLIEAFNLSLRLCSVPEHAHEGLKFVREQIPIAERALGPANETTLKLRRVLARVLVNTRSAATWDANLREAETIFSDILARARQVFGEQHPLTKVIQDDQKKVSACRTLGPRPIGSIY
jgi:hypothetical protein